MKKVQLCVATTESVLKDLKQCERLAKIDYVLLIATQHLSIQNKSVSMLPLSKFMLLKFICIYNRTHTRQNWFRCNQYVLCSVCLKFFVFGRNTFCRMHCKTIGKCESCLNLLLHLSLNPIVVLSYFGLSKLFSCRSFRKQILIDSGYFGDER